MCNSLQPWIPSVGGSCDCMDCRGGGSPSSEQRCRGGCATRCAGPSSSPRRCSRHAGASGLKFRPTRLLLSLKSAGCPKQKAGNFDSSHEISSHSWWILMSCPCHYWFPAEAPETVMKSSFGFPLDVGLVLKLQTFQEKHNRDPYNGST